MASLDIHTLIVITAVVTLLTAFLLATFSNVVPSGIKGHKLWIASFLIYSVSTGLAMAENAQFPQLARYASSVLEVIAGCVLYAGVCQFFARPIPRALIAGCILFELGILTGSLLSADGGQLRWMALIFARGLLPLGIAWVAWTARTKDRWVSGVNLGALAAFSQFIVVLLYAATESSPRLAAVLGFTQTLFMSTEMALAIIGAVAMI